MLTKLLSVVTLPINFYIIKTLVLSQKNPLVTSQGRHTCVYAKDSLQGQG